MIGFLCILGGAAAQVLGPPAANQSEALGKGTATLLFFIAGVVLIVMHFVRSKR